MRILVEKQAKEIKELAHNHGYTTNDFLLLIIADELQRLRTHEQEKDDLYCPGHNYDE